MKNLLRQLICWCLQPESEGIVVRDPSFKCVGRLLGVVDENNFMNLKLSNGKTYSVFNKISGLRFGAKVYISEDWLFCDSRMMLMRFT